LQVVTLSFENTHFAIFGASGGIGSALSRRLKSHGAHLVLLGRSSAKLAPLAEELGAQTQSSDASKVDELEQTVAAFGSVNGIVNCAGSVLLKPAHLTTESEWKQSIETNLTTA
jgi:NADP-dependent 3-hydroxy acid dehydrogenase YdfG